MTFLVTGAAGFIGFHATRRLLDRGERVIGLDRIDDYYDPALKFARLERLGIDADSVRENEAVANDGGDFTFYRTDLADREAVESIFEREGIQRVCHLAAQAGVRYSLENPRAYAHSNITGFLNILEGCREHRIEHLVYASSSSVYGLNESQPFSTSDNVDHPVSLYAASKKSNELMAHSYSHLFGLPVTGLRFFTVYGPYGRPDMALFLFTKAILEDRPIDLFNEGEMSRDFTYVDDIVESLLRVMDRIPAASPDWSGKEPDPSRSSAPYRVYNIGNGSPVGLRDFVEALEAEIGKKATRNLLPMQPGDVRSTWADTTDLERDTGFRPRVSVQEGIRRFVAWYREFYGV